MSVSIVTDTTPLRITLVEARCAQCGRRSWLVPIVAATVRACQVCQGACPMTGRFQITGRMPYDGGHRGSGAGPSLLQAVDMTEPYRLRMPGTVTWFPTSEPTDRTLSVPLSDGGPDTDNTGDMSE